MIAKISSSASLEKVLGYNFKKVANKEASIIYVNKLYNNFEEDYSFNSIVDDIKHCIPNKCRTKNKVFHCSLNPHPDDKLDDEKLIQIARDYMNELGYGEQSFIVFKHNDIAREHIHIVSLRVDSEGKKINDKFEKRRSKKITDKLEQKYGLIPATQTVLRPIDKAQKIDTHKGNIKSQITDVLKAVVQHYSFRSIGELNAILSYYQLTAQEVKTEYRGKQYNGIVYIPIDNKGEKIGIPIHAKDLGRGYGYRALQTKMQKAKEEIYPHIPSLRHRIIKVMQTYPSCTNFHKELEKVGLKAFIRTSEQGRIYGITFIDDKFGIAVNGSRLGKNYSANAFHKYFTNPSANIFFDKSLYHNDERDISKIQSATMQNENQEEFGSLYEDIVDEILEVPFSIYNDDWKEKVWQKKLRRQSKPEIKRRK